MSAPAKKPNLMNDEISEGSDENEELMDDGSFVNEEVQVDFEARTPEGGDIEGIIRMLKQHFLKAHVDVSGLASLILEQSHIASVIKQSELPEEDMSEDDDDEDPIFGITTAVNLTQKKDVLCLSQIRAIILDQCTKCGTDQTIKMVHNMFNQPSDTGRHVGLILNERLVNIPPQIAAPLLENLSKEITAAREKKEFSFEHLLFICKVYKLEDNKTKKSTLVFSKPEDQILREAAISSFEYSIIEESDSGLGGDWDTDDVPMKPFHLVLILPADKLDSVVSKIRDTFT